MTRLLARVKLQPAKPENLNLQWRAGLDASMEHVIRPLKWGIWRGGALCLLLVFIRSANLNDIWWCTPLLSSVERLLGMARVNVRNHGTSVHISLLPFVQCEVLLRVILKKNR